MEELELLEAVKKGDREAFAKIVEKYHDRLYFTAFGITHSSWDALDICQETFIKVFTGIKRVKDLSRFGTWINRILVNKCMDYYRKSKNLVIGEAVEKGTDEMGFSPEGIDLARAILSLNKEARTAVILRYYQGLSIKEISAVQGCPEGTVKSRLNNALKELRKKLCKGYEMEV